MEADVVVELPGDDESRLPSHFSILLEELRESALALSAISTSLSLACSAATMLLTSAESVGS
jgi:hypothetical protein